MSHAKIMYQTECVDITEIVELQQQQTHIRSNSKMLSIGKCEMFAIIENWAEVLDALRVDITINDDPPSLANLSMNIVKWFCPAHTHTRLMALCPELPG